ncbi:hypothetical protein ABZ883_12445 [Streptomyces sp. NPDC046977]|uniref:hypothetical protein n=1 Tax=Streptomyces sp. NPDC046977 TaxID=3154703 RepID=UPI0033DF2D06
MSCHSLESAPAEVHGADSPLAVLPGPRPGARREGATPLPQLDAALCEVFDAYEALGTTGPAEAWAAFTDGFQWTASLPAAEPAADDPHGAPTARPADGGHMVSGTWRPAAAAREGRWIALPVRAGDGTPVFAVRRSQGTHDVADGTFRVSGLFVPTGMTSSAEGTALGSRHTAYAWCAALGMAFGFGRLLLAQADGLPAHPEGTTSSHLTALLTREREAVRGHLRRLPVGPGGDELLAERVRAGADLVRDVYAAGAAGAAGPTASAPLLLAGAPLLQFARFATELLPPGAAGA